MLGLKLLAILSLLIAAGAFAMLATDPQPAPRMTFAAGTFTMPDYAAMSHAKP